MRFSAYSHENLRSAHKTTLEFTKDSRLTLQGDCIIGVRCDFDSEQMINLVKKESKLKIIMKCGGLEEVLEAVGCSYFSDSHEAVIRKSSYVDKRTFAVSSSKAARDISRDFVAKFKSLGKMEVEIFESP
jgi:uncharacterized protein